MGSLRTPVDLGDIIRQRRKALTWDQAALAHEVGVSRQWIIDIEKGKPRAELHLVLRTLNVLGLQLTARSIDEPSHTSARQPSPDIDQVLENNRAPFMRYPMPATAPRPALRVRQRERPDFNAILRQAEDELAQRAADDAAVGRANDMSPKERGKKA